MNAMFILVVCFGILILGVIIFGLIVNTKAGGRAQPTPWMRRLRQFQDKRENTGWRIQMIPYDGTSRPMMLDSGGVLSFISVAAVLGFLAGMALAVYDHERYVKPGLILGVSSWVVALLCYWLKARLVRLDWDVAQGRCVDRELRKVRMDGPDGGGWGWFWRIVCQYEYLGIPYRVTPEVYWANFNSEEAAMQYLDKRISPTGECTLRVDPKNPLRTELMGQGIKDKLLY